MPEKIRLLDEIEINKIAAGEVIESADSVIKELVENALDAGASEVAVETKSAGRSLIAIKDDGLGMGCDDLLLSVERHATSKISGLEDLRTLSTLGFRGEALASVASVSKMQITTSDNEGGKGYKMSVAGGKILSIEPATRMRGTTIEVRSLFYNVPVRKEFQKSMSADQAAILKTLTKLAFCHPSRKFSWTSEGKLQFGFEKDEGLQRRAELLLGEQIACQMVPLSAQQGEMCLSGLVGKPLVHRPNRTGQFLFLNERPIVSPCVAAAVLEGFGTRLATQRYPLFLLHLELPSHLVDVNVHPQKKEVRFASKEKLSVFVAKQISKLFAHKPQVSLTAPQSYEAVNLSFSTQHREVAISPELPLRAERRLLKVVGTLLLVTEGEKLFVIDSVQVRVRLAAQGFEGKNFSMQQLLLPLHFEFSSAMKSKLERGQEELAQLGISIHPFGGTTFVVDALASCYAEEEIEDLLHGWAEGQLGARRLKQIFAKGKAKSKDMSQLLELAQEEEMVELSEERLHACLSC